MAAENSSSSSKPINPVGLLHMIVVYFVWGSTYLAIRVAVREGAGFPPFMLGFTRVAAAGTLLLLWSWLSKHRIKPTRQELPILAVSGLLFWAGANGLVNWAEQRADSGLAALVVASLPIWMALLESILDRKLPSRQLVASLLVGFLGIALLSAPTLMGGIRGDILSLTALIFAPIIWAVGSVLQTRKPIQLGPRASAGYQMLAGGVGFAVLAILLKEPPPTPTQEAWWAWVYLVLIGAVLGFTSFLTMLRLLPSNIAMTYAYINPVVAVILGWLILREDVTLWTLGGSALVLVGVAGVFRERYKESDQ